MKPSKARRNIRMVRFLHRRKLLWPAIRMWRKYKQRTQRIKQFFKRK